jgi:hypothetical protein
MLIRRDYSGPALNTTIPQAIRVSNNDASERLNCEERVLPHGSIARDRALSIPSNCYRSSWHTLVGKDRHRFISLSTLDCRLWMMLSVVQLSFTAKRNSSTIIYHPTPTKNSTVLHRRRSNTTKEESARMTTNADICSLANSLAAVNMANEPSFNGLPPEIRLQIWRLTLEPRILNYLLFRPAVPQWMHPRPPLPAMAHVDSLSRKEFLKIYELQGRTYGLYAIDIIEAALEHIDRDIPPSLRPKVRSLLWAGAGWLSGEDRTGAPASS